MNLDPQNWSNPEQFHGFRFVESNVLKRSLGEDSGTGKFKIPDLGKSSGFVDLSDWQLWGTGRSSW